LRSVLLEEKSGIANLIQKCPVLKLNNVKKYPESVTQAAERKPPRTGQTTSKNSLDPNLNFPAGTPIETILELQLRDLILETEEKIFLGALGSLKVIKSIMSFQFPVKDFAFVLRSHHMPFL